jgi:ABC-type multidrug transport system fused ATPase/permease subunit
VIDGVLSFGAFTLFMAALLSLIKPFKKLSQVNSIMEQAVAASSRIYEILETQATVKEKSGAGILSGFNKDIVFEDVWNNMYNVRHAEIKLYWILCSKIRGGIEGGQIEI